MSTTDSSFSGQNFAFQHSNSLLVSEFPARRTNVRNSISLDRVSFEFGTQRKSFFRIRTLHNPQRTVYRLLTDIFTLPDTPPKGKGPIWSVGYNPNQTVYGPDAVCTTELKHVVKPLYSCSKCTCYVYKMFSNSLYNAVHIITKRCHCPVMHCVVTICSLSMF